MRAVNLIPAEQRGGASVGAGRSGGAVYVLLGTVGGLALLALLYGLAHHQVSSRSEQVVSLEARAQKAQASASQLAPYTNFVSLRQQRAQAVETLVDSRFDWAHVMHEFGRVLPASVSIAALSGTVGSATGTSASTTSTSSSTSSSAAAAVASATPPGSVPTFAVSGCAVSQAAVAEAIARLRLIDGVSSVSLQSSTKSGSGAGGSGAGGGCVGGQAAYAMNVSFQPLPTANTPTAATSTVATNAGSAAHTSTATSGVAR
jgi:Tfp pilus assembly protein PilN